MDRLNGVIKDVIRYWVWILGNFLGWRYEFGNYWFMDGVRRYEFELNYVGVKVDGE